MAEFVEQELEDFVPVLEQLQATELLTKKEISSLIKRARRYDYRLNKSHKKPEDYLNYASFICDLLDLLYERRSALGYYHKKNIIEGYLKKKASSIYRRLCQRFQGRLEYWKLYLKFITTKNLKSQASKGFLMAIQMHPHSIDLRVMAAKWEMEGNNSVDNARRGLQLALRTHPESIDLWATLLSIEIDYVEKLKRRKELLTGSALKTLDADSDGEEQPVPEPHADSADAVMQLKLAEIVAMQAIETMEGEKNEERMNQLLLSLWRATSRTEDANVKRIRDMIEERMNAASDAFMRWRIRVEMRKDAGENIMDILDEHDWTKATVLDRRYAIQTLRQEAAKNDDALARARIVSHLTSIVENDEDKATEEELEQWMGNLNDDLDDKERRLVEKAIERFPGRALFWRFVLAVDLRRMESEENEHTEKSTKSAKTLVDRVNVAIGKTKNDDSTYDVIFLYRMVIDLTIKHFPSLVEKLFSSSLDCSVGEVHRELKKIRFDYLLSILEGDEDDEGKKSISGRVEKEIRALVLRRPNSVDFYLHVADAILTLLDKTTSSTLTTSLKDLAKAGVAEHSESDDAWMAMCEYLMEREPLAVADVCRRALLSLKGESNDTFIARYTMLQQEIATKRLKA